MSGRRRASLALLLISLLLVASCGSQKKELTAAEILTQAGQNTKALNSVHFALESQGGATPLGGGLSITSAEGDIVKPNKLKVSAKASLMGQALDLGLISLPPDTYITNPLTGQWQKAPAGFVPAGAFDLMGGAVSVLDGLKSPKKLANETVDGTATYHLQGTVAASLLKSLAAGNAVGAGDLKIDLWIGVKDLLPHQVRIAGPLLTGDPATIARQVTFSRFNQSVTIAAPQ